MGGMARPDVDGPVAGAAASARGVGGAAPVLPFSVDGWYFGAGGALESLAGNSGFFSAFDGLEVAGAGVGGAAIAAPLPPAEVVAAPPLMVASQQPELDGTPQSGMPQSGAAQQSSIGTR